jgi:DNA mismatch repair protein MutL
MPADAHIRILPPTVANKIAAGEVVERPASLVKELVENAVDAGSTQIDIEVSAGGRRLVSVSDNGRGMNRDDALLCVERHATSKIRDVDDIEHIATLGFRGEALAAIASVSRFRLVTCRAGEQSGTELIVTGGKMTDVRDIGCPPGTRIEVRDLFFNVPARRKFLRAYLTEQAHIRSEFMVQAVAKPAIGWSLTIDGNELHRLPASATLADRLRDLFGPEYIARMRAVEYAKGGVAVTGYTSLPSFNRADRSELYFFVNGRATSASLLTFSVREGYHTLLSNDRFPSVFLAITLDPTLVDVNVHPTKKEVRFRRPGEVRDAVINAIRSTLAAVAGRVPADAGGPAAGPVESPRPMQVQMSIDQLPPTRIFRYPRWAAASAGPEPAPAQTESSPDSTPPPAPPAPGAPWSWCRVLGQVGGLYVVMETEDGLVLMDPHAAHERVMFDRFMGEILKSRVASQNLLIPQTVELTPQDALRVRRELPLLREMGFGVSEFGGDTFVVDALPSQFSGADARDFLVEVSQHLEQSGSRAGRGRWREESIAQAACKAAIKAHDRLSLEEIEQLVTDLAQTEMPYTCPHGRPTIILTSLRELNRRFSRE